MFRALLGHTTSEAYEKWAGQEKQEVLTDILPEKARLHWFGPRRDATQGRVLLFFYGALRLSTFLHIHSLKLGLKLVLFFFFRRRLQPAPTTGLFFILTRPPERRLCRLG